MILTHHTTMNSNHEFLPAGSLKALILLALLLTLLIPSGTHAAWPANLGLSATELQYAFPNITPQSDGTLLVDIGLLLPDYSFFKKQRILRLLADGAVDPTFPVRDLLPSHPKAVLNGIHKPMPDGGILVIREEFIPQGDRIGPKQVEYRLLADGSIDESFPRIEADGYYGLELMPEPDGKLLVYTFGGPGALMNGQRMPLLFRLNAKGSLDAGFNATADVIGGLDFRVWLLPEGKLLLGAWGTDPGSPYQLRRVNADGSTDPNFQAPQALFPRGFPPGVHPLSDGQILVRSGAELNLLRTDGSFNTNFVAGEFVTRNATSPFLNPKELSDGRLFLLGLFQGYSGTAANGIVRLEADGTIDTSFRSGRGFSQNDGSLVQFNEVWPLPMGRVLIDGTADRFEQQSVTSPFVLNADGTLDPSFTVSKVNWPWGRAPVIVRAVSEGHALFWTPKGLDRAKLPSVESIPPARVAAITRAPGELTHVSVEAIKGVRHTLQFSESLTHWTDLRTLTATTNRIEFTDEPSQSSNRRFYRVRQEW